MILDPLWLGVFSISPIHPVRHSLGPIPRLGNFKFARHARISGYAKELVFPTAEGSRHFFCMFVSIVDSSRAAFKVSTSRLRSTDYDDFVVTNRASRGLIRISISSITS